MFGTFFFSFDLNNKQSQGRWLIYEALIAIMHVKQVPPLIVSYRTGKVPRKSSQQAHKSRMKESSFRNRRHYINKGEYVLPPEKREKNLRQLNFMTPRK